MESVSTIVESRPTKINLRRLVLKASGGFRGRTGGQEFALELLKCFGWEAMPEGAESPSKLPVIEHGKRSTRQVEVLWGERRVIIDIVDRDVSLDTTWSDLLRACLQLDPVPQYVVLSNQRDLHLYDLARDREAPRLNIAIDQLPKYSEAFPFLSANWTPGSVPKIINVEKVSEKIADLIAKLYRSLIAEEDNDADRVTQFTLQCIIAMFAEDIGFFPQEYFTTLLYEGAANGDTEIRLAELFVQMDVQYGSSPEIPYFNGGLFTDPVVLPLNDDQLRALTKAAEANWSYIEPHIFGSVFQGIMDDEERHATGGHYTAREDIMRIVGPTIIDPWRERITAASTLTGLQSLLKELAEFRVLDPACGSGNFLYVAFRELYRLETELLCRMHEFASVQSGGRSQRGWGSSIRISNFFGIDTNSFAVELAKTTLNMAKKIAFEERNETIAARYDQLELEVDQSLPLDNLDENIVCDDALFRTWPTVDAIVGNPPFLGDRKLRGELGSDYLKRLRKVSGISGVVDLCCYWFRLAQDHLQPGARAGFVGTSGIRIGKAREASLGYIVGSGGTITNAVSTQVWQGEAALHVSIVNWVNGHIAGPHRLVVDGHVYERQKIHPHLQLHADVSEARKLEVNKTGSAMGIIFGSDAFKIDGSLLADLNDHPAIRPVATGGGMLRGVIASDPDYCINLLGCDTEAQAKAQGGSAFEHLREHVFPMVSERASSGKNTHHYARWLRSWWEPREPSKKFFAPLSKSSRMLACSNPQARPIFAFLSCEFVPNNTLQLFSFNDDYCFGILQSTAHWRWTRIKGGKVREDFRYTGEVWKTFPWPQEVSEADVVAIASAGRDLRQVRKQLMEENSWSLRDLYRAVEVEGPHPLKAAQEALDKSVAAAYHQPPGQDVVEFLLDLNLCLAEDEASGHTVQGPGLPAGLDADDPRWTSTDCIEPPMRS